MRLFVCQVRMKAICVLESILRRKDDEHFAIIESYFIDNKDLVVKCSDSPQSSLREKANKVFLYFLINMNMCEIRPFPCFSKYTY